jgi:trans-aconitate methyltransferase
MDRYTETFNTWNKVALLYQEKFMDLDLYNNTYDVICDSITKKGAAVLDVGCGPGNITRYLLSKRPDFNILGIDVAPNMVELARKNNPTARFSVMDSRQIEQLTTTFDGIVAGFCLPYLSPFDVSKLFTDCFQLLHNNGLLYVSFVEGESAQSGYLIGSSGDRTYFYFHTSDEIIKQLKKEKFDNIQLHKVEYQKSSGEMDVHTILAARKNVE